MRGKGSRQAIQVLFSKAEMEALEELVQNGTLLLSLAEVMEATGLERQAEQDKAPQQGRSENQTASCFPVEAELRSYHILPNMDRVFQKETAAPAVEAAMVEMQLSTVEADAEMHLMVNMLVLLNTLVMDMMAS